jgi:hypothetical protein
MSRTIKSLLKPNNFQLYILLVCSIENNEVKDFLFSASICAYPLVSIYAIYNESHSLIVKSEN